MSAMIVQQPSVRPMESKPPLCPTAAQNGVRQPNLATAVEAGHPEPHPQKAAPSCELPEAPSAPAGNDQAASLQLHSLAPPKSQRPPAAADMQHATAVEDRNDGGPAAPPDDGTHKGSSHQVQFSHGHVLG